MLCLLLGSLWRPPVNVTWHYNKDRQLEEDIQQKVCLKQWRLLICKLLSSIPYFKLKDVFFYSLLTTEELVFQFAIPTV